MFLSPLTLQQASVFHFVCEFMRIHGRAPTLREIDDRVGIAKSCRATSALAIEPQLVCETRLVDAPATILLDSAELLLTR
jgi:LexA DNA binding domain